MQYSLIIQTILAQGFFPLKIKITQFPDGFHLKILKKGKLECLIFEMLLLRDKRTVLNTQADSCETVYLINVCLFSRCCIHE